MLAHFSPVILSFLLFALGFSAAQRLFRLELAWRWILAYPIGMALGGLSAYFLWLLELPWNFILILLTTAGVFSLYDLFGASRQLSAARVKQYFQKVLHDFSRLEPLETLLLASVAFSALIVTAWHFFLQPVVWDTLVLYNFRALAIADGWQIEEFFGQFTYDNRILYDFLHPFLSSIWQALAASFGAPNTTFLYLGLIASVLAHAAWILPSRKSWIAFATLLLSTPLLLTVWTQNYAVEPYFLLWTHLALMAFTSERKQPQNASALLVLFLVCTMLLRVSEPYWIVFLVWFSWPIVRSEQTVAQKLLQLSFYWLPALAVFAHWGQLQEEAKTWVQVGDNHIISTYDPSRYGSVWENILSREYWVPWLQGVTLKNPLVPFLVLAFGITTFHGKKVLADRNFWLLVLFTAMLFAAYSVDLATDWNNWQLKSELWARTGLPLVAVAVVFTALKIQPAESR